MISIARTPPRTPAMALAPSPVELLAELDAQLRDLAAVSEDSYLFVVGQALDVTSALLEAHTRCVAS